MQTMIQKHRHRAGKDGIARKNKNVELPRLTEKTRMMESLKMEV